MDILNDKKIKKIVSLFHVLLIILILFLIFQTFNTIKSYSIMGADINPQAVISVSGEGEVFALPDTASFNFSVVESASTSAEAQELANRKMRSIRENLLELGIEEKDIKTSGYNLFPRYEYPRPTGIRVLVGYEVSHNVSVKVRNIDEAGKVLESVGRLELSNISGLNFLIEDENELIREARQKAIEDAKEKAEALSKDLGVKLVRIIGFYDSGKNYYDMPMRMEMSLPSIGMGGDGGSVEVMTGENRIYSTVNITYEIR